MKQFHIDIDENGEIEIPAPIRDALGIRPGDEIVLELREHEIVLKPVSQGSTIFKRRYLK